MIVNSLWKLERTIYYRNLYFICIKDPIILITVILSFNYCFTILTLFLPFTSNMGMKLLLQ